MTEEVKISRFCRLLHVPAEKQSNTTDTPHLSSLSSSSFFFFFNIFLFICCCLLSLLRVGVYVCDG